MTIFFLFVLFVLFVFKLKVKTCQASFKTKTKQTKPMFVLVKYMEDDEFVLFKSEDGEIMGGGYRIDSRFLKEDLSTLLTKTVEQTGGQKNKNAFIPAGLYCVRPACLDMETLFEETEVIPEDLNDRIYAEFSGERVEDEEGEEEEEKKEEAKASVVEETNKPTKAPNKKKTRRRRSSATKTGNRKTKRKTSNK